MLLLIAVHGNINMSLIPSVSLPQWECSSNGANGKESSGEQGCFSDESGCSSGVEVSCVPAATIREGGSGGGGCCKVDTKINTRKGNIFRLDTK